MGGRGGGRASYLLLEVKEESRDDARVANHHRNLLQEVSKGLDVLLRFFPAGRGAEVAVGLDREVAVGRWVGGWVGGWVDGSRGRRRRKDAVLGRLCEWWVGGWVGGRDVPHCGLHGVIQEDHAVLRQVLRKGRRDIEQSPLGAQARGIHLAPSFGKMPELHSAVPPHHVVVDVHLVGGVGGWVGGWVSIERRSLLIHTRKRA